MIPESIDHRTHTAAPARGDWMGSWILFSCIVFGIPLLLINAGLRQLWEEKRIELHSRAEQRLEQTLTGLEARGETHDYLTRLLGELGRKAFSSDDPPRFLATWIPRLKRRFPGMLEMTVLDREGSPIVSLCDVPPPRILFQRYVQAYRELLRGNPGSLDRESRLIRGFLGTLLPIGRAIHGRLQLAGTTTHRRYLFCTAPTEKGMLFVHLTPGQDWLQLGIREEIRRLPAHPHAGRVTLVDLKADCPEQLQRLGISAAKTPIVWQALQNDPRGVVRFGGAIFSMRQVRPSLLVVGSVPEPRGGFFRVAEGRLIKASLVIFLILTGGAYPVFAGLFPVSLSVRSRLILGFLFAAGLPLMVMAVTARFWLADRLKTLEAASHAMVEKALRDFDGRFPHLVTMLEKRVGREFMTYQHPAGQPVSALETRLEDMRKVHAWDSCRVYDRSGKTVLERSIPELSGKSGGLFGMLDKVASRMLSHLDLDGETPGGNAGASSQPADREFERAFSSVSTELGRITSFDLANERYFTVMYPIYDSQGRAVYFVLLFWGREQLEEEYVRRRLEAFGRQLDECALWAYCRRFPDRSVPRAFRHTGRVKPFLGQILSSERSARSRFDLDGETLLLTGLRGKELSGWNFVAVSGERGIRLDLDRAAWNVAGVASVVFLMSGCVGLFLARVFLIPVRDLAEGVESLAGRNFDARVPVRPGDEFGDLADGFNQMMEGLADLESARAVQETLFPQKPLLVGEWQVYGTCRPAAQLGGDYIDFAALPENRALVAIGNVPGRGVSSALVMAMAKAVIAHPETGSNPARVLRLVQDAIDGAVGWKKQMTLLCGILDAVSGVFTYACSGEMLPLIVRAGETLSLDPRPAELYGEKLVGMRVSQMTLDPGDLLFLCTEGLTTTLDRSGTPLGLSRIRAALPGLKQGDAVSGEKAISDWLDGQKPSGPLAKDVSMILLQHVGISRSEAALKLFGSEVGR